MGAVGVFRRRRPFAKRKSGAAKAMFDRTAEQFDLTPLRLVADGGYGSAVMVGWLVDERGIEPHVNLIDNLSARTIFFPQRLHIRYRTRPRCLPRG
jgi:hypothetical protein